MDTLEAIANRKSTRSFKDEQIPYEALDVIIEAGCAAPIAFGAYDSMQLIVVQSDEMLEKIAIVTTKMMKMQKGIEMSIDYGAKTMIIVASKDFGILGIEYANAATILENMVLAATSIGVDNVIMGAPIAAIANDTQLMEELGIESGYKPLLAAVFGYANEDVSATYHSIPIRFITEY